MRSPLTASASAHTNEENRADQQIDAPDEGLEHRGMVSVAQEGVEDIAETRRLRDGAGGVPQHVAPELQPMQLLHVFDGVSQETGGEDHQEYAHHPEELAHVELRAEFEYGKGDAQCYR